jgi:hypothetical protein
MPIVQELWRSVNGVGDLDFTLFATAPDNARVYYSDVPVISGRTYFYKVRRLDIDTGTTSPWSNIVELTPGYRRAQIDEDTIMPLSSVNIGAATKIGIGLESVFAQPVKAQKRLEYASSDLVTEAPAVFADSLFNSPSQFRKAVVGAVQVAGDVSVNITPEGPLGKLLCGTLGAPVTTAIAGPPARNSHLWKNTFGFIPFTITEQKGPYYFATTGCRVGRLTFSVRKTQDRPVFVNANVWGVHQLRYDVEADTGLDTAGVDTLEHYPAVSARMVQDGSLWAGVQDVEINIDKQLERVDELDGYRGMGHYSRGSEVRMEATVYFSTDREFKAYFGQSSATVAPYGLTMAIRPSQVELRISAPENAAGYINELNVRLYRAVYSAVGQPVAGRDAIMQRVTCTPMYDAVLGTDFDIEVVNGETNANIILPSVAIPVVPANAGTSYSLP